MKYLLFVVLLLSALAFADFSFASSKNLSSPCVERICQKLGAFSCDSQEELEDIAKTCQLRGLSSSCFEHICQNLSYFEQDTWPELKSYLLACRYNEQDHCVSYIQSKLGFFDLDEGAEWAFAAESCQRVSTRCLSGICERLGVFECNTLEKLGQKAQSCRR